MRTLIVDVLALIGGFFVGIALPELVGIIGFLLFDRTVVGLRFLPIVLTLVRAGAAPIVDVVVQRRC
ncbi:MAG: DUF5957 family protein [Actinomycetota bacterium]|nr:DUF5957 family protein [Actinomycetota bacterium]